MSRRSTSQILQEARALVAAGWCRGPWHTIINGQHCYCTGGAVLQVLEGAVPLDAIVGLASDRLYSSRAMQALNRAAHRLDPEYSSAISYNETRGRTQQEILALFDLALEEVTK